MTEVSRLELDHPALGTPGGAGLHASIQALYVKLGNNIGSRLFYLENMANAATADMDHNFGTDITNLRYDIYLWDTGTQVLTRVTPTTSPALSAFPVIERPSFEDFQARITNSSGAERDLVVCLFNDVISTQEGDIADIDTTTVAPEDGQALVFNNTTKKFIPGASGDSSFKLQSVSDPNAGIKGGYIMLEDGRELATYDGSGSASTDYGSDLTLNLDTILGSNPANATLYYLYIDLNTIGAAVVLSDNGRTVYGVVQANFALLTTTPAQVDRNRYIECGFIKSATTGTVWSGSGAAYGTTAFRQGVRSVPDRLPENFMANGSFERSVTQGVTATSVTAAAETSAPLVGSQSLKLTSQASTGTVSLPIAAAPAGYNGRFPLHASGLFLTDASDANGDWTVGVYNTTDAAYVSGSPVSLVGAGTAQLVPLSYVPQTGKSYEWRIARTITTTGRVLLVDALKVSREGQPTSAIVGPYQVFTPNYANIGGATTNFSTGFGYRDGEFLVGSLSTRWTANGSGGQNLEWVLPTYLGETLVSKVSVALHPLGTASYNGVSGDIATNMQGVLTAGSGSIPLRGAGGANVTNTNLQTTYFNWTWHFRIPIASWAATGTVVTQQVTPRETAWVDNTVLGFAQFGTGTTRAVASARAKGFLDVNGVYSVEVELKTASNVGSDAGTAYRSTTMTPATGLHPAYYITNQTGTTESFVAYVQNSSGFAIAAEGSSTSYGQANWAARVILASKPTWWDTYVQAAQASSAIQEATTTTMGLRAIPNATLYLEGATAGAGSHGTTNTRIRRFLTSVENTLGADATLTQSASLGDSVLINKAGIYFIEYRDQSGTTGINIGISRTNATLTPGLTTDIQTVTPAAARLGIGSTSAANAQASVSVCRYLEVGDIIRAHTNAAPDETAASRVNFRITRIF